ncbi:hypothetical protein D3C85_1524390 [compost metagenome]
MGQVREQELGLQLMRCCCQWRHVRFEVVRSGAACQLPVVGQLLLAIDLLYSRRIPLDLECITPLFGLPVTISHDRHAFSASIKRYTQHRLHAFDSTCRAVI